METLTQYKAVVLDVETTGLSPITDRVIEVCAIGLKKLDEPLPGEDSGRVWLINPGCEVPEEATEVHGITTERLVREGRPPEEAIGEILDYIGSSPVVGHNAGFDHRFLRAEAERIGRNFDNKVFCTLRGYRKHESALGFKAKSDQLGDIAKGAGWDIPGGGLHTAKTDALLCYRLFLAIRKAGGLKQPTEA